MVYGVWCTVESSNVRQVILCVEGRSVIGEGEITADSAADSDRIRALVITHWERKVIDAVCW